MNAPFGDTFLNLKTPKKLACAAAGEREEEEWRHRDKGMEGEEILTSVGWEGIHKCGNYD